MRIVAVGGKNFVSSLRLVGVEGIQAVTPSDAMKSISSLVQNKDIGLILVTDDVAEPIRINLDSLRMKNPVPLIYEIPSPSSSREPVDYKQMLKRMLGV